jgi:CubicO group peptidase (beta-lactamase class C family)
MKRRSDGAVLPRGLGRDRLERVRAYVDDQVHRLKRAPFMQVRILRSGEGGAFTHTAGRPAPPPAPAVADPDTLLRIYSMTKPIVSAAAMILVERAVLHLDHPVERYLPCFADMRVHVSAGVTRPAATKMTVQQLLTHSAGLTYNFFPGPVAELYKAHGIEFLQSDLSDVPCGAEQPGALRAVVEKLAALPLVCDPGTAFHYSFATDVVGCLIETLTGKLLGDFLREEIFEPLGMADTGFHVPREKAGRFAACYALQEGGEGGFRLTDEPATSAFLVPRRHLTSGGGGLISTLNDYSKFGE